MPNSKNLQNLKAAYAEWGKSKTTGNIKPLQDLMADNFKIGGVDEMSPGMAFAVDRNSKTDAIKYLNAIFDQWEMLHFTPKTFVEQANTIAMFGTCRYKNNETGKEVECGISNLWEFKDGKAVSLIDLFDSAKAAAAATP